MRRPSKVPSLVTRLRATWVSGLCLLILPFQAAGQSFDLSGGTSSLINASGFAVNYKWAPVDGWVGLAATDQVRLGGALRTQYNGYNVSLGDQIFPFVFDTDVFERYQYFDARGVAFSRKTEDQNWMIFAGTAATDFSTSFARSFASSGLTGAVFYERKLSSRISFTSRNVFRRDVTSIQSVGIQLAPKWKISAAGGIGANSPYAALATQYKYRWVDATAAYIASSERFDRIRVAAPIIAERTGPNLRIKLTPSTKFSAQVDSEKIFVPVQPPRSPVVASLNSVTTVGILDKFSVSSSYLESKAGIYETRSQVLTVGRNLGSRIDFFTSAVHAKDRGGLSQTAYVGRIEEKVVPRLTLRETATVSGGRTTAGYGGDFLSNRISLGANYQTIFNPLAVGLRGRHIYQAWVVNVNLALSRGVRIHYDNFVDAFGGLRYTAYANGIGYSHETGFGNLSDLTAPVRFYENIIRATVQDEKGQPVWGIAVRIGNQTVFSDKSGQLFLRVKDHREYPLTVSLQDSVNPARYEVVRAPSEAVPQPANSAKSLSIVVRRVVELQRRPSAR
jgi:hypothetical protein